MHTDHSPCKEVTLHAGLCLHVRKYRTRSCCGTGLIVAHHGAHECPRPAKYAARAPATVLRRPSHAAMLRGHRGGSSGRAGYRGGNNAPPTCDGAHRWVISVSYHIFLYRYNGIHGPRVRSPEPRPAPAACRPGLPPLLKLFCPLIMSTSVTTLSTYLSTESNKSVAQPLRNISRNFPINMWP